MRKALLLSALLLLSGGSASGGVTATLVKTRAAKGTPVVSGQWHAGLSETKAYAEKKKLPLVAVWSNGDVCGHCTTFESACNSSYFRDWMKKSGMVFYFAHSGDPSPDGPAYGAGFNWCRKTNLAQYPFVRLYWPSGGVDKSVVGDTVDGGYGTTTGGKKIAAYLEKTFSRFTKPSTTAIVKPYKVFFDANGGTGEMPAKSTKVGVTFSLPANAFMRKDYSFAGWAKTASGSVAYKDRASVRNLTTVSNGVVNLYAKWTRIVYRTYYTGLSYTITMSGLKGYTTSSKVSGLKWNSAKGAWTGKPTKGGTFTVKLVKGTKTATRKIVVVKDGVVWADGAFGRIFPCGGPIELDLSPTSLAGLPRSIAVNGLPEGVVYADGVISGTPVKAGTFRLIVTIVSAKGQTLSRAYDLRIGVPDCCIGTFNGFIGFSATNTTDELALLNRGTFRLSAPSNASLSAKIVTAKGTYALTGLGWTVNGDRTYTASLVTSTGKDRVCVTVEEDPDDGTAPLREVGVFTPSYGTGYEIWAQRAPFERNADGSYVNAEIDATMRRVTGKWWFKAYAVGSQWVLMYTTSKLADLTMTVGIDGTTRLAGKVGGYPVSASSALFIFAGDIEKGCVRADFPVPVTVSKTKKTLDIWTNLWFDRLNTHFNMRGEGIGGATLEAFR